MTTQRTGGMTTIGVLNIIFGSIGGLLSLLMILGGGFLAAGGANFEAEAAGTNGENVGAVMAGGGMLVMILGIIALVTNVLLLSSGIGVLKLAPWGRTLSLFCGGVFVIMNAYSLLSNGFALGALIGLAYGGLLLGLFMTPQWKAAFSPQASAADEFSGRDQFRAAA